MKVNATDFDNFWEHYYQNKYRRSNAKRFKASLRKQVEKLKDTVLIDDYVFGLKNSKESTRKAFAEFYKYLMEKGICDSFESSLFDIKFFDNTFERQMEIAKFLHTPHTTKEIMEEFGYGATAVKQDLLDMEDGIEVLGAAIKIKREKKGRSYYYKSTLHPVFLPLNLTEVYALTTYLNKLVDCSDPNVRVVMELSARIKSQLSDYAFNRLFPNESSDDYRKRNDYVTDESFAKNEGFFMYLMKTGTPCRFFLDDKEYRGAIVDWSNGKYRLRLEDGTCIDSDLKDIDFVIDDLEYR